MLAKDTACYHIEKVLPFSLANVYLSAALYAPLLMIETFVKSRSKATNFLIIIVEMDA